MKSFLSAILFLLLLTGQEAFAQTQSLYTTTLLRAAPGELPALIDTLKAEREQLNGGLLIMRHSQGDHWDLMLLRPFTGIEMHDYRYLADFQHDFVVASTVAWDSLSSAGRHSGLFHIEMFHAKQGKYAELLEQRRMENVYYNETERAGNVIFTTRFGSDVDIYTLGFYNDMVDFATGPDLSDSAFEKAAETAGFASLDRIGFYLRELILKHHDTLATPVE